MEDLPNPDNQQSVRTQTRSEKRKSGSSSSRKHSRKKQDGGSVTSSQSKSKMEIRMASDKSVVLDFCSDSSDDDDDGYGGRLSQADSVGGRSRSSKESVSVGRGTKSRERLLSPPTKSGKLSGSDQGSIFSESDDDFCIVDTPTSTKVVSTNLITLIVCCAIQCRNDITSMCF